MRVLLQSRQHFELIGEEKLELIPVYYHPHYQGWWGLMRLWKDFKGTTDLIIGVPQVPAINVLALKVALGARYSAGEALPRDRWLLSFSAEKEWTKSILKTQEEIIDSLGIEGPLEVPSISLTSEELEWSEVVMLKNGIARTRPVIGLHCSATTPSKRWPAENFGRVILELKQQFPGLVVISFGVNAERPDADTVCRMGSHVRWVDGIGRLTIRQSLALLKRCDLVISGDTGIMHLAAAVGTKTLSIFGPTSSQRLAPSYNGSVTISPDTPCHPCYRDKYKNCDCIRLITPERVAALAKRCLKMLQPGVETAQSK